MKRNNRFLQRCTQRLRTTLAHSPCATLSALACCFSVLPKNALRVAQGL
jgi:hypothetical protein